MVAPPNPDLFPDARRRLGIDHQLSSMLARAKEDVDTGPVNPTIDRTALQSALLEFDFETPVDFETLLAWVIARLRDGLVHIDHPRYAGLFNPAPTFAAQCADRIVAQFNPQLASATTSPAAVEIERHVIAAIAGRIGLGQEAAGHFTSGGSEANFTALICALTRAEARFASVGSQAFSGQPFVYLSRDSHLAWIKIAHQAGIGRDAVRMIPTDGEGRLNTAALEAAMIADQARGDVPVMVVATAGTTNAGMVDLLTPIAAIARRHGLWFHVDAAWGGALIASARWRHLLDGIEAADSVTIDAHKWFAVTMGCGMYLTRHAGTLAAAFNVKADFMPSNETAIDPYLNSVQWSRRFLGLRLFMSLAAGGWAAYAAHVDRAMALTAKLRVLLRHLGWFAINGADALAVACMIPPEGSAPVAEIAARVVASGVAWVSVAAFEGRDNIRLCVTHGETGSDDILKIVEVLEWARSVSGVRKPGYSSTFSPTRG